jgi:hypothetical protein
LRSWSTERSWETWTSARWRWTNEAGYCAAVVAAAFAFMSREMIRLCEYRRAMNHMSFGVSTLFVAARRD